MDLPSSMCNIFGSVPSERPPLLTDLLALYGRGSLEPIHWLSDRLQGNLSGSASDELFTSRNGGALRIAQL
jgi:hypothetical protein